MAQYQELFQHGTRSYGSWASAVKETHQGTNPTSHGSVMEAGWGLGDLIHFIIAAQRGGCICLISRIFFILLYKQKIDLGRLLSRLIQHYLYCKSEIFPSYTFNCRMSATYNENFIQLNVLEAFACIHCKQVRAPVQYFIPILACVSAHISSAFL